MYLKLLQIGLFLLTGIPNKESMSAIDHYMETLGTPQNKQCSTSYGCQNIKIWTFIAYFKV